MQRLAGLVAALSLLGCASEPPVTRLTFVTTREAVVEPEVLATGVEAGWCYTLNPLDYLARLPWKASYVPSYGHAIALALAKVPGANVMTGVSVQRTRSEYLLVRRVCSTVKGDVGRIE
jgi:hypothetical protein